MSVASATSQRVVFGFPSAIGHVNPTLPIVRELVRMGHDVHYLTGRSAKPRIEAAGGLFYDRTETLYRGRERRQVLGALARELGVLDAFKVRSSGNRVDEVVRARLWLEVIPNAVQWLAELSPALVVYCPILTGYMRVAADAHGIPSAAILTVGGHGALSATATRWAVENGYPGTYEGALSWWRQTPGMRHPMMQGLLAQLADSHGLDTSEVADRLFALTSFYSRDCNLVTTIKNLSLPVTDEESAQLARYGYSFHFVGPLTEPSHSPAQPGDSRGGGETSALTADAPFWGRPVHSPTGDFPIEWTRRVRASGRRLVLCALGTLATSDQPHVGWRARPIDPRTDRPGASGKQALQAVWRALFAEFGRDSDGSGTGDGPDAPLLVVAIGEQPDALDGIAVPANAICHPFIPQRELLALGPELFVTHAGQNSLMESLSAGVPVVAAPRQNDQHGNAARVESLGVGRAVPALRGGSRELQDSYARALRSALRQVFAAGPSGSFGAAARQLAEELGSAGGVPEAVSHLVQRPTGT